MPKIRKSILAVFCASPSRDHNSTSDVVDVAVAVVVVAVAVVWVAVISNTEGSECTRTLEFDTSVRFRDDMACTIMW